MGIFEPTTHIAGVVITLNDELQRQRCGWCSEILIDYDLRRIAVLGDQPGPLLTWPVGGLVVVDGSMSYALDHVDGEQLPADSCTRQDDPREV